MPHAISIVGHSHRCAKVLDGHRTRTNAATSPVAIIAPDTKSTSGRSGWYQKVGSGVRWNAVTLFQSCSNINWVAERPAVVTSRESQPETKMLTAR